MNSAPIQKLILRGAMVVALIIFSQNNTHTQREKPEIIWVVHGDTMYHIRPAGSIPSINDPVFVTREEASEQMYHDEPVVGLVIDGEARAYSLWHLEHHEIVNDSIGDSSFAVTW